MLFRSAIGITCQLRYYPSEKGLNIGFRIVGKNALDEQFAQNFKDILDKGLAETSIKPIIGVMQYQ